MRTIRNLLVVAAAACAALPAAGLSQDASVRLVDELVPVAKVPSPDAVAVVIGNRNYVRKDLPAVKYAIRDAAAVRNLLVHGMGFRAENVIYVEDATRATFDRIFGTATELQGQLADYVKPGKSDVFVFYSGHGTPDPKPTATGKPGRTYFVPTDADPDYIRLAGYAVDQLYGNLSKLQAKSLTVVIDACFSGFSDGGALVTDASPALLMVDNPVLATPGAVALSASSKNQIASWYPEAEHGLLTYWFLKGMQGEADADNDRVLTAKELGDFIAENVKYMARRLRGREQTPQVMSLDKARPMIAYSGKTAKVAAPAPDRVASVATAQPTAQPTPQPQPSTPAPVTSRSAPAAAAAVNALSNATAKPPASRPAASPAPGPVGSATEFIGSFTAALKGGDPAPLYGYLVQSTLGEKGTQELLEFVKKFKPTIVEVASATPGAPGETVFSIILRARGDFGVANNRQLTITLPTDAAGMGTVRVVTLAKTK